MVHFDNTLLMIEMHIYHAHSQGNQDLLVSECQ